jgi:hypothetical protein
MDSNVSVTVVASVGTMQKTVKIKANSNFTVVKIGNFLSTPGYNRIIVNIKGAASGNGVVSQFNIDGPLTNLTYVPNNDGNNFYWGRRGSSCNISPDVGNSQNISYFYS